MPLTLFAEVADAAKAAYDSAPAYFRWLHDALPTPFFHTRAFVTFLALVFVLYWSIPRRYQLARVWLLVVASFHFYAAWSFELAFLVTATTTADYLFGRAIGGLTRDRWRRLVLFASVGMNLAVLCYFKYRGFFLNELYDALAGLGYDPGYAKLDPLAVFVPFGISFYTFEAISYAVDVYRRKTPAETSLPRFLLFVLFFPHLVAGPIVRAGDFLPQTRRPKRWNWVRAQVGVQLFLVGLFKKAAVADRLALFSDPVFENPAAHGTGACWLAVVAYAVRIYCDFSGYSDMAVGTAHLLGYRLARNFDLPYLAANVSEFWRRWHISLSTWLRDYVFIPLGGSRGGRAATCRNLLIVMAVGGLWHGAAWGYVLWGLAHGLLLVAHRLFRDWCEPRPALTAALGTWAGTAGRVAVTFLCVTLCWVLFQPDVGKAMELYGRLFTYHRGLVPPVSNKSLWVLAGVVVCGEWLARSRVWERASGRVPAPVVGLGYATCLLAALVLAPEAAPAFIYFQF
ncbi:MAG: MBOAT family protein [Isosphaera sp.]|nr:MBOAT family protein [Isosphaera sp.]